jgi:hypothetical protein
MLEKFDIGWHDANTLIMRLRRFSELKKFAQLMEGGRAHVFAI